MKHMFAVGGEEEGERNGTDQSVHILLKWGFFFVGEKPAGFYG